MDSKIIDKIRIMLDTAGRTEEEAQSCFLKAQELMMKHHIEIADIEDSKKEKKAIGSLEVDSNTYSKEHKVKLLKVIAENFRCEAMLINNKMALLGLKEDTIIAVEVFNVAHYMMANRAYNLRRKTGVKDDYGSYMDGFIYGLKKKFEEQIAAHQEWGLVVVKDALIVDFLKTKTETVEMKGKMNYKPQPESFTKGFRDGKKFEIDDKKKL